MPPHTLKLDLSGALTVPSIVAFLSTVVARYAIHISSGFLLLLFSVAFVVPSFPALRKNDLVADPIVLIICIIIIIRLIV